MCPPRSRSIHPALLLAVFLPQLPLLWAEEILLPPEDAGEAPAKALVHRKIAGNMPDGAAVEEYTLEAPTGLRAKVLTYGATLVSVEVPDRDGKSENITLHLDGLQDYLKGHPLFGSVVGRFANRIAGARFTLDGATYELSPNAGRHHIHGGQGGFQKLVWDARPVVEKGRAGVVLSLTSPDGDAGYPGTLEVKVTYTVTGENELRMEYEATTDKPTIVNLTNHAYWNLAGAGSGDVLGHVLMLNADGFLPTDRDKIPTGEIRKVEGTPMDFRSPEPIGSRIRLVDGQNYDHCYVLRKKSRGELALAARVSEPRSGRVMEVLTTQPGVQLYTARGLNSRLRAGGVPYGPYHGFCLETQHFPDSPNHPDFPSVVLRPGETYRHVTVHRFLLKDKATAVRGDRR